MVVIERHSSTKTFHIEKGTFWEVRVFNKRIGVFSSKRDADDYDAMIKRRGEKK